MKIIHCADLHLDSPLSANMNREQAGIRNAEILQSFVRLTQYAREQRIDAVLIAGDLFDGERVTSATVGDVLDAIRQTPEVDYLYLAGNHDNAAGAFSCRALPENLFRFSDQWRSFDYEDALISGIEITQDNCECLYHSVPHADGKCNVVVLHGQVGTSCGVGQVNLKLLSDCGIDYLALGHLHSYAKQRLGPSGFYCYSGCLEGRGFDECGEKGFVLAELERGRVQTRFVPFASRRLHRVAVDVTGLRTNGEVLRAMALAAADLSERDMVEYLLTGADDPTSDIALPSLQRSLRSRHFFTKLKDERRLTIDPADYQHDVSLKGELIRLVLASELPDEEKTAIIRAGLAALAGEEIAL